MKERAKQAEPSSTPGGAGGRLRVLVVEDDADTSALIRDVLDSGGYACEQVYTSEDAPALIKDETPDAIILDLMLPGMSGNSLCERLKMRRSTNLIPIIILTALRKDSNRFDGLRVGANCYLTKPFKPRELLKAVADGIQWRRQMEEMGVDRTVNIDLHSDLRLLDSVNDLLTGLLMETDIDEMEAQKVKYAVLEMGHNAIEWGNRRDAKLLVSISCSIQRDRLVFRIRDEGQGFDPDSITHVAKPGADPIAHFDLREQLGLREGGFGILLSRNYMDEVKYNETGNEVTLTKYLKPGSGNDGTQQAET